MAPDHLARAVGFRQVYGEITYSWNHRLQIPLTTNTGERNDEKNLVIGDIGVHPRRLWW